MSKVEDLLKFYAGLNMETFNVLADELLGVDSSLIEDQLAEIGPMYATYLSVYVMAKKHHSISVKDFESWCANEKQTQTRRMLTEGTRPTAVALENHVTADPEYDSLQQEIIDRQAKLDYCKGFLRAIEIRRDSLVQICSLKKKEANIYN